MYRRIRVISKSVKEAPTDKAVLSVIIILLLISTSGGSSTVIFHPRLRCEAHCNNRAENGGWCELWLQSVALHK